MFEGLDQQFMAWVERERDGLIRDCSPLADGYWQGKFQEDYIDFDEAKKRVFPKATPLRIQGGGLPLFHFYRQFWACFHAVCAIDMQTHITKHESSYEGAISVLQFVRELASRTSGIALSEEIEDQLISETVYYLDDELYAESPDNKGQAAERKRALEDVKKLGNQLAGVLDRINKPIDGIKGDLHSFLNAGVAFLANMADNELGNMEPGKRGRPGKKHLDRYVSVLVEVLGNINGVPVARVSNSQGYDYYGETLNFVCECLEILNGYMHICHGYLCGDLDSLGRRINEAINSSEKHESKA